MINKLFVVIILWCVLFSSYLKAQQSYPLPSEIESFANTTLLVVLDGRDISFDAFLKDAISNHWKLTEYLIVDSERFNAEKGNPEYSFLVTLQIQFENDPENNIYHYLQILLSHQTADIQNMPVIMQIPFVGSTFTSSPYLHKTDMIVKFLHNYATNMVNSKQGNKYGNLKKLNSGIKELKGKTLMLSESQIDLELRDVDVLRKVYKGNIELVDDDSLVDAIERANPNTVFLHLVYPHEDATSGKCIKMIIEPATGKAFYYKTHSIRKRTPPVFLKQDFRRIRWYPFHWL